MKILIKVIKINNTKININLVNVLKEKGYLDKPINILNSGL